MQAEVVEVSALCLESSDARVDELICQGSIDGLKVRTIGPTADGTHFGAVAVGKFWSRIAVLVLAGAVSTSVALNDPTDVREVWTLGRNRLEIATREILDASVELDTVTCRHTVARTAYVT